MPSGYSLHVGIADASRLRPKFGRADGADHAAIAMRDIATACGLNTEAPLLNAAATKTGLRELFDRTVDRLRDGDLLMWTLAGHGEVHVSSDGEEVRNQAFVLIDNMLIDDEIHSWLQTIRVRARVVVVIDACVSGSLLTSLAQALLVTSIDRLRGGMTRPLPFDVARTSRHPETTPHRLLTPVQLSRFITLKSGWRFHALRMPARPKPPLAADVLLLAASSDEVNAAGLRGDKYPPFTKALVDTWDQSSSYWDLLRRIRDKATHFPEPVLNDRLVREKAFLDQQPFRV